MLTRESESEKSGDTSCCSCKYDRQASVDYAHYYTQGQGQQRLKYVRYISEAADAFLSWANPEYFYYRQNCAAFISQCLYAGGIPMDSRWYHRRVFPPRSSEPGRGGKRRRLLSLFLIIIQRLRSLLHAERWDVSETWRKAPENFAYFSDPASGFISGPEIRFSSAAAIPRILAESGIRTGDLIYLIKKGRLSHCLLVTRLGENEIYYSANCFTRYDMELSEVLERDADTVAVLLRLKDEIERPGPGDLNG